MKKILILEANFYQEISAMLRQGAIAEIEKSGYEYDIITLPGAFEIAGAIAFAKDSNKYDGYVALGCVIRGETSHYDYVCQESARGLNELAYKDKLAIGYGIITVENQEQALARAQIDKKNKGGFAANTCLRMIELKKKLEV